MAVEAYEECETIRTEEFGYNSQPVADVILAHAYVHSDIERGMLAVGASLSQLRRSNPAEHEEEAGAITFFKKGKKRFLPSLGIFLRCVLTACSALGILISINGPNDISVASTLEKMGMAQFRVGKLASARRYLEDAVDMYRDCGRDNIESKLVTPLFVIGNIHSFMKNEEEAERVWTEAHKCNLQLGDGKNDQVHEVLSDALKIR